jgi:hypothetical protein
VVVLLEKESIQGSELDEIREKYPEPDLASYKTGHVVHNKK